MARGSGKPALAITDQLLTLVRRAIADRRIRRPDGSGKKLRKIDVAEYCGVKPPSLTAILDGETATSDTVLDMCELLEIPHYEALPLTEDEKDWLAVLHVFRLAGVPASRIRQIVGELESRAAAAYDAASARGRATAPPRYGQRVIDIVRLTLSQELLDVSADDSDDDLPTPH